MDNKILETIIDKFNGGPVGVGTIATAVGEDAGTIEEVYEPFLIQKGLLFKGGQLCIPKYYMRYNIIQEKHSVALSCHFGLDKTLKMVCRH